MSEIRSQDDFEDIERENEDAQDDAIMSADDTGIVSQEREIAGADIERAIGGEELH